MSNIKLLEDVLCLRQEKRLVLKMMLGQTESNWIDSRLTVGDYDNIVIISDNYTQNYPVLCFCYNNGAFELGTLYMGQYE